MLFLMPQNFKHGWVDTENATLSTEHEAELHMYINYYLSA